MNGYLLSVIGTVLLSAVLTAIAPNGKTAFVIKNVAKLACLLVIVSPLLTYVQREKKGGDLKNNSTKEVINTDESFIQYYSEMKVRQAEETLEKEIFEKLSLSCKLTFSWELLEDEIFIRKITVLSPIDTEEKESLYEYLTKNYCSEVVFE